MKESKAIGHEPQNMYLFWDFILIYFYAWPMVTTKMSVWIANFSKTYVYVGVLLSKKQLQLQITMGNNCHIIVFVATYILATYIVFKKHIISTHSLQILYADRYPIFTDKILHVEIIQNWCFSLEKKEKRTFRHEMFSFWLSKESSLIRKNKKLNPYSIFLTRSCCF